MTQPEIVEQLLELLSELTEETEGYLERQDDAQLWYNRGYANGMAAALRQAGLGERVDALIGVDPYENARDQDHLPWGKAYVHGRSMGEREALDILS
jgi:hypothetical protein